jgi:tetratricopeptide (TPR) repeat protein
VWDPVTGQGLHSFLGGSSVVWNPDGRRLAVGGMAGTIAVRDAATGELRLTLRGHDQWVRSLAYDADGRRLASAGQDGVVKVWDLASGRERLTLLGHSRPVARVAWHPDGKRLASAGADGTVRIWDTETGREILSLRGHGQYVSSVAWSPDGRKLATVGADGTVKIRDASAGRGAATVARPVSATYCWHEANTHLNLALLLVESGRAREADDALGLALGQYDALADNYPTWVAPRKTLASRLMNFARVSLVRGNREQADRAARRGLDTWRRLAAEFPRRREIRDEEVSVCLTWAEFLIVTGRYEQAGDTLATASTLQDRVDADLPRSHYNIKPLRIKRLQADARFRAGRLLEADATYRQGLEVIERLTKDHTFDSSDFHIFYNSYAWFLATCPDAGLRRPDVAVDLARKATKFGPKNGEFWNKRGVACYRAGDWPGAIEALEKSMELRRGGDPNDWFFLAMAHWQTGDKTKARTWYDRAIAWTDKNQPKNEELLRFRAEATALIVTPEPPTPDRREVKPVKD